MTLDVIAPLRIVLTRPEMLVKGSTEISSMSAIPIRIVADDRRDRLSESVRRGDEESSVDERAPFHAHRVFPAREGPAPQKAVPHVALIPVIQCANGVCMSTDILLPVGGHAGIARERDEDEGVLVLRTGDAFVLTIEDMVPPEFDTEKFKDLPDPIASDPERKLPVGMDMPQDRIETAPHDVGITELEGSP